MKCLAVPSMCGDRRTSASGNLAAAPLGQRCQDLALHAGLVAPGPQLTHGVQHMSACQRCRQQCRLPQQHAATATLTTTIGSAEYAFGALMASSEYKQSQEADRRWPTVQFADEEYAQRLLVADIDLGVHRRKAVKRDSIATVVRPSIAKA